VRLVEHCLPAARVCRVEKDDRSDIPATIAKLSCTLEGDGSAEAEPANMEPTNGTSLFDRIGISPRILLHRA
jgi:hypothetical protein